MPKNKPRVSVHRYYIALLLATASLTSPLASAYAFDESSLPSGEKIIGGEADFDRSTPNVLNIKQYSDRLFIDWYEGFNIGEKSSTHFYQPDSKSIVVNRVMGKSVDPTRIFGELTANGKIVIIDGNGIIFGKSSRIDVGGIIATTGQINPDQFLSGEKALSIEGSVKGSIINNGQITVGDAGLTAFVAPLFRNDGLIVAKKGTILVGNAAASTLDLYGDGLIELKIGKDIKESDVANYGKIDVEGGQVLVTAAYVDDVVKELVNMTEISKGGSFRVLNGKIIISEKPPEPEPVPDPVPTPDPVPMPDPTPVPDPVPTPDPVPVPDPVPMPAPILEPEIIPPQPNQIILKRGDYSVIIKAQYLNWDDIGRFREYTKPEPVDFLSYSMEGFDDEISLDVSQDH